MGGSRKGEQGTQPFDIAVAMNIDMVEFPKIRAPIEQSQEGAASSVIDTSTK